MKLVLALVAALSVSAPALAGDRVGGSHSSQPYVPSNLIRDLERTGLNVDMTGETGQRHNNITQSICSRDDSGNPITISGEYRYNGLAGEYRLQRSTVTITSGCGSNQNKSAGALAVR